jgi:hypothetical protein
MKYFKSLRFKLTIITQQIKLHSQIPNKPYFIKSCPATRRELCLKKQSAQYLLLLPIPKQSLSTKNQRERNGRRRKMGIKISSISLQAVLYPDRLHELPLPLSQQRWRLHARKPHRSLSLSLNLYMFMHLTLYNQICIICLFAGKTEETDGNKIWVLFTLYF